MTREQFEKADDLMGEIEGLARTICEIEDFIKHDGTFYSHIVFVPSDQSGNKHAEEFNVSKDDLKNVFLPFLYKRLGDEQRKFAEL